MGARRRPPSWPAPRGATAPVVAIVLVVLVLFLGLVLDLGHLLSVRGELQNASDAAALAGAKELDGTLAKLAPAEAAGDDFARRHATDAETEVVPEAIELGHWTDPAHGCGTFGGVESGRTPATGSWAGWRFCRIDARDSVAARDINAVRVASARASGAPGGGAAPVFLGGVLGQRAADVEAEAVAVTGGPCTQECPEMPLVIRAGCLGGADGLACGHEYLIGLSSAIVDTAGWTNLVDDRSVSAHRICEIFQEGVGEDCGLQAGSWIGTSNGNELSAACKEPERGIKTLCEWFQQFVGKQTQIPVIEYPGEETICEGGYSGMAQIVGFATFAVTGAWCKEGDIPVGPCAPYATQQCISLQFICDVQDDEEVPVGCGWWGTSPLRPQLVR